MLHRVVSTTGRDNSHSQFNQQIIQMTTMGVGFWNAVTGEFPGHRHASRMNPRRTLSAPSRSTSARSLRKSGISHSTFAALINTPFFYVARSKNLNKIIHQSNSFPFLKGQPPMLSVPSRHVCQRNPKANRTPQHCCGGSKSAHAQDHSHDAEE
jgi:hypothetical protein